MKYTLIIAFFCLINTIGLAVVSSKKQSRIDRITIQKDSLLKEIDSLKSELFIKDITIGRYEITHEIFKEKKPEAFKNLDYILQNETE